MEGSSGKLYINTRSETWELFEIFGGYWRNFQTFQSLILGVNLLSCKIGRDIVPNFILPYQEIDYSIRFLN